MPKSQTYGKRRTVDLSIFGQIRNDRAAMGAAGQDTAESAAKIRSWQEQQKDFVKQTGLKRQSAREQIAGKREKISHDKNSTHKEQSKPHYEYPTTIISSEIGTSSYRRLFDGLGENKAVTREVWKQSSTMLKHRSGTRFEDLVFIDSKSGKCLVQNLYDVEKQVLPSKSMKNMVRNSEPYSVIAIHNHPENSAPSLADIYSAYVNKYKYGVIACHNGMIFRYKILHEYNDYTVDFIFRKIQIALNDGDQIRLANSIQELYDNGIEFEVIK